MVKTLGKFSAQFRERRSQAAFMWTSLRTMRWSQSSRKIILLGSPHHSNLGDQAQTLCTEDWLRRSYPDHHIVVFDTRSASVCRRLALRLVGHFVSTSDTIYLHSGYHTTDLYPLELGLQKWAVRRFTGNQVVVLPQTINFVEPGSAEEAATVFNAHQNLHLLCRDTESYALAQRLFTSANLLLYPDIVTSRIGTRIYDQTGDGIQLCVRRDVESVYFASGQIARLEDELAKIGPVTLTDTNAAEAAIRIRRNLKPTIENSWDDFARYKVTVTDRYHGVIFSLIAGTPVVVLESTDHKLRSGVRWFPPEIFGDYIAFAKSPEDAVHAAERLYKAEVPRTLPPYFEDEFYSKLLAQIAAHDRRGNATHDV